jgi:ABC-type phosphate transport system substrate-binding protein
MKNKISIGGMVLIFTGLLFLHSYVFVPVSRAGDVFIIANKEVPDDSLTRNDIKGIFLGEKVLWNNQQKITFVILKTKAHEDFLEKYIGNTPAQYRNYWKKMVFTGKSKSPRAFDTAEEIIEYVANTGGAVGYIPSEAYHDKVKIISEK